MRFWIPVASSPFLTFPEADLSSWGHPQSIFIHRVEDSYAPIQPGPKGREGGSLGVWREGEWQKSWGIDADTHESRIIDWRGWSEGVCRAETHHFDDLHAFSKESCGESGRRVCLMRIRTNEAFDW